MISEHHASNAVQTVGVEPGVEAALVELAIPPLGKACRWFLALSAVSLSLSAISIWHYTLDDAYIAFRYAQNIAAGWGPVFNAGQRVEGYTDFLWVVLLAGGAKFISNPILVSKVLGLVFHLSTLLACYCLARRLTASNVPLWGFALLLTATNTYFIVYTVADMETPLFTSLLCWSLVVYLRALEGCDFKRQARWLTGASVLLALLVLTRPDGALTYALLWFHAAWVYRKHPRLIVCFTLPLLAVYIPYFVWRWHYYGFLFPNTFYVKRGGTLLLLNHGALQTGKFFAEQGGGWFVSALVLAALLVFPAAETSALGLAIASRVLFELWSGGVTMGEFRFLISVLPLIWLLTEHTIWRGFAALRMVGRGGLLLPGVFGLLVLAQVASFQRARTHQIEPVERGMEHAHIAAGKWLAANASPTTTIAVGDIGAIGFWSHARILDLDGLTETHISHLPGALSEKQDPRYVLQQAPGFIILRTSRCNPALEDVSFGTDKAVFSDPQFKSNYVAEACWEFWPRLDLVMYRKKEHRE